MAVSAYQTTKQILHFGFAEQSSRQISTMKLWDYLKSGTFLTAHPKRRHIIKTPPHGPTPPLTGRLAECPPPPHRCEQQHLPTEVYCCGMLSTKLIINNLIKYSKIMFLISSNYYIKMSLFYVIYYQVYKYTRDTISNEQCPHTYIHSLICSITIRYCNNTMFFLWNLKALWSNFTSAI